MPKIKSKSEKSKTAPGTSNSWRIKFLFVIFFFISAFYVNRLYYLQVVKGEEYAAFAQGIFFASKQQNNPLRGKIYFQDKAGLATRLAATNVESPLVYANPRQVEDEEAVVNLLSQILNLGENDKETILRRLTNKQSSYALIARDISEDEARSINDLGLKGIYTRDELKRIYPAESVAAHLLGFLGFEGDNRVGQYGVEEYYDDILTGKIENNFSLSNLFAGRKQEETADIVLTIDYGIQFVLEKKLQELYENLNAVSASALYMDPKTGAIIAMAQYPNFDPNRYQEVKSIDIFKNKLTQSLFEFGSVVKPVTMAAAIDAGAITPQTVYEDTGSVQIGSHTIRNFDGKARGTQTMTEALELSLNTGAIFAQQKLGKKKFREYMEAFQFDKPTKIDLPGEVGGNIRNIQVTNRDINYATASFGQGISSSPMRLLTSISAIANQGKMMQPYIVDKIITPSKVVETKPKQVATPISALTASRVAAMLVSVVDKAFDRKAGVRGYDVAAKTGTAQIPNPRGAGYLAETLHSVVGFAPAYDPAFVGIIIVEAPKGIRFASDSTAPTWGEMANFILQYYKIPPQRM